MDAFNAGTDPMVEAYVTAMMPAANAMHGSYKERFYAMMHTPLQLGTVFQFLLEIQKQFSYGIAPGVSFSDRLEEIPAIACPRRHRPNPLLIASGSLLMSG